MFNSDCDTSYVIGETFGRDFLQERGQGMSENKKPEVKGEPDGLLLFIFRMDILLSFFLVFRNL